MPEVKKKQKKTENAKIADTKTTKSTKSHQQLLWQIKLCLKKWGGGGSSTLCFQRMEV